MLVDGAAYFTALADAIERAERSVLMVGWDFHSRVRLRRGGDPEAERASELVALLESAVRRRRRLRVRVLAWDFPMLYALEREWLPLYRFDLSTHRRIRLRLDDRHPLGGSQHQKLVVVDDAIAFSGGLDVTICRWDTPEHRGDDRCRDDPGFPAYAPFHDVQMLVDGDAALALGELARERWRLAGGRRLRRAAPSGDPWPNGLVPDLRDVDVGISLTRPEFDGRPGLREVEALYLDSIRAAKRSLYIENQYLTSHRVGDALAARLAEPDGPEVVIVLPASLSGWLETNTMGVLMGRIGRQLREADRFGRLRLLRPRLPGDARLTIHSKVAIVDDRLLRVGSANLSNRSMGLDSECDLSVESSDARDRRREIRRVRDRLLGEHLGVDPERVGAAIEREGSIGTAIDALAGGERTLVPVDLAAEGWLEPIVDGAIFDPERPIAFEALVERFGAGEPERREAAHGLPAVQIGVGLCAVGALLAAWQWTPLAQWVTPEALTQRALGLDESLRGGTAAVLLFALAASLLVPVTALIAACGVLLGAVKGSLVAIAGSLLGAAFGWATGRLLWRDAVRRLSGRRLDAISRGLAKRGVLATAALRLVPIAPFGVVNLVAGASHLRARDFLLGTLLGMAPGTVLLATFGDRAAEALRDPDPAAVGLVAALLVAIAALGVAARRWLAPRGGGV